MDDELLHGSEGQILLYDGRLAPHGGGVKHRIGGISQPVQIMLLSRLSVQGRAAEPVHRRAGTVKINAQRFGRDLPHRGHGEHLAGLVEQKAARPQQHAAVIAAFLDGAAAHIDQLPRLRLARRKGVIGAPLRGVCGGNGLHPQRKNIIQHVGLLSVSLDEWLPPWGKLSAAPTAD